MGNVNSWPHGLKIADKSTNTKQLFTFCNVDHFKLLLYHKSFINNEVTCINPSKLQGNYWKKEQIGEINDTK